MNTTFTKVKVSFGLLLAGCSLITTQAQAQLIKYESKDSLNGKPKISSALIGRLKLNGIYDISGNLHGNSSFLIHENDVFGRNKPAFWVDMRQSQIRFTTTTQLKNGKEIRSMLEGDFEGGPNRTSLFRLRHAWIKYNNFTLGQNWSTFGDSDLWPASLLDWDGPTGMVLSRRIQLNYKNKFNPNGKAGYEVAVEQMEPRRLYDYTTNDALGVDYAPKRMPDVIGALRYDYDNGGFLKVAGIYRNVGYDSKNLLETAPEVKFKSENGWGATAIASIFFNKKSGLTNNLQAQFNVGKGIADYFLAVGGSGLDGFAKENKMGELNLLNVHAGFISYQRFWTPKFHTMVIASYNHFYGAEATASPWNEMTNYHFTLNLSYNILDNLMVGFEPQIGYKELHLDEGIKKGKDAVRINFGMLYNF
ncbi:DcaP family trimeric outer membrane transporter [Pedobacter gandavensis]|uniref:DcaP family trimeric outer membrane transporter n=1 Tax=Pedobacter gandavensis TaxID=2679963 RepID=UPI00292FFCE6|nr:DcaP family trimeric outer membrane transporter [Pedobacter gandavensis]